MTKHLLIRSLLVAPLIAALSGCVFFDKKSTPSIHNLNVVLPKALAGDASAKGQLGSAFNNSYGYGGIETDAMASLRYLQEAAEADNGYAQLALGNIYRAGTANATTGDAPRIQPDLDKALYWLQRAASQRQSGAYYGLMQLYGAPGFAGADPVEACKWALITSPQSTYCTSKNMSAEQIDDARRRVADWQAAHPVKKP